MAPDIYEVVIATLVNPVAGFGLLVKKVVDKIPNKVHACECDGCRQGHDCKSAELFLYKFLDEESVIARLVL